MGEKRYVVPEQMRLAVAQAVHLECGRVDYHPQIRVALEAAVRWLAENPVLPTDEQIRELFSLTNHKVDCASYREREYEWQRRMFLAPEPEVPEAVKDLLWDSANLVAKNVGIFGDVPVQVDKNIIEAYRRGRNWHGER